MNTDDKVRSLLSGLAARYEAEVDLERGLERLRAAGHGLREDQADDNPVRIGLWGGPRSGKTTIISALAIAALHLNESHSLIGRVGAGDEASDDDYSMNVTGVSEIAARTLNEGLHRLVTERRFPAANMYSSSTSVMWSFHGQQNALAPGGQPRWLRRRTTEPIDFALQLQDFSGESFDSTKIEPLAVESLALSEGLIYVFDPVLENQSITSWNYFDAVLREVATRVRNQGRMEGNKLPHHVAVLVNKFDDPGFFNAAVEHGWVNQEQSGARMPYVSLEQGPAFFDWVCSTRYGQTTDLIRNTLRTFFHADRVEYFASSGIGFKLNSHGVFDFRDYANVETRDGELCIRSPVRPVNVIEPLIRLERRIRQSRSRSRLRR